MECDRIEVMIFIRGDGLLLKLFNGAKEASLSQEELLFLITMSNSLTKEEMISKDDLASYVGDFYKIFEKSLRNQSEMALTLSEMRDALEEEEKGTNPEITGLVALLVETADMVEAFYKYALQSENLALVGQAELMWKSMLKKYALAGLSRIPDEQTEVDALLNRTIAVDNNVKEGIIANTVRSGYVYKGELIRKSEVIVGSRKEL